ncbi:MAG: ferredoxin [DPANN group archaeon]|nr:ferredoxin [DPANN group archaeon]
MTAYRIEHDRPNCIGCAACAAIAPDFWKMDDKDGKSDIVDGVKKPDGQEERDIEEQDLAINKEAAESCPVNVIHLKDLKTGERII